jgi:hypothetical protein
MRRVSVALLAVTLLAGCGGGGGGRLSKQDLVKRGDALCQAQRTRDQRLGATANIKALAAKGDRLLATDRAALATFARLRPPSGLQDEFDAYVKLLRDSLETEAQLVDAARNRDVPGLRRLILKLQAARPKLTDAARKVGFTVCSQDGG